MDTRQLKTFHVAATTLNFTQTATLLDYAQSSITAQIKSLEKELNVTLFERICKRVILTEAGHRLLEYAEKIISLTHEASAAVSDPVKLQYSLTLSAPETIATYYLPVLLQKFKDLYPQIQLIFRPFPVRELLQRVEEGQLDCAFILERPTTSTSLTIKTLVQESIVVLAHPAHPLTQRPTINGTDLRGEVLLLTETGCSYRSLFLNRLKDAGVEPSATLDFSNVETIKHAILNKLGIGVLPAITVSKELKQGSLVALPWNTETLELETQIVWKVNEGSGKKLRQAGKEVSALAAFLKLLEEYQFVPSN